MWISLTYTILLRIPTAYIMAALTKNELYPNGQPIAIFTSLLVAWVSGMIMTVIVFSTGRWKKKMYASAQSLQK